jgi:hypothetical protein
MNPKDPWNDQPEKCVTDQGDASGRDEARHLVAAPAHLDSPGLGSRLVIPCRRQIGRQTLCCSVSGLIPAGEEDIFHAEALKHLRP